MIETNIYPQQPEWQLDAPCTRENKKPFKLWTCMSQKEMHIALMKFLHSTHEVITYSFNGLNYS